MANKTASVMTRVDPIIKEQAEVVLTQLGISMSTAMEVYLRQIALQRKIPFEMKLPSNTPIVLGALSDNEFNGLMENAVKSYADGKSVDFDDFKTRFGAEIK